MTVLAAGILFVCNGNALFLKRSNTGNFASYWGLPGGKIEGDETAEQAACRECIEEIGSLPKGERVVWTRSIKAYPGSGQPTTPTIQQSADLLPEPVDFTTFIQKVDEQFTPKLDVEHVGWAWAPISDPPQPLHPGVAISLARFDMHELDIARAMAAGDLTSPQRYHNVSLFSIRITGTGVAYRQGIDEFVFRRPEHYATEDFLARCNGLSVIWVHPDKAIMNSKEFNARIVGSVMLPFIRQGEKWPEVWGIAKIYDDETIEMLLTEKMSTSPSVLLNASKDTLKATMEDGSTILVEGEASLLDHIALVPRGVWDKSLEASGVESIFVEEARADAVVSIVKPRFDASKLNAINSRVTALSIRMRNHVARRA